MRRRWLYTQGGRPLPEPVEVTAEWTDAPRVNAPVTDLYMDGVRTLEGEDISSRKKRREYMRRNNLADTSDFKGVWDKAEKEREAIRTGQHDKAARREAIARALYQLERGKRQ